MVMSHRVQSRWEERGEPTEFWHIFKRQHEHAGVEKGVLELPFCRHLRRRELVLVLVGAVKDFDAVERVDQRDRHALGVHQQVEVLQVCVGEREKCHHQPQGKLHRKDRIRPHVERATRRGEGDKGERDIGGRRRKLEDRVQLLGPAQGVLLPLELGVRVHKRHLCVRVRPACCEAVRSEMMGRHQHA